MRPGQAAPVFAHTGGSRTWRIGCFNEAGAGCPGIPARSADRPPRRNPCFNEAGAGCPGIPGACIDLTGRYIASMRPGQAAPVFGLPAQGVPAGILSFNEAGAGCPGIRAKKA